MKIKYSYAAVATILLLLIGFYLSHIRAHGTGNTKDSITSIVFDTGYDSAVTYTDKKGNYYVVLYNSDNKEDVSILYNEMGTPDKGLVIIYADKKAIFPERNTLIRITKDKNGNYDIISTK